MVISELLALAVRQAFALSITLWAKMFFFSNVIVYVQKNYMSVYAVGYLRFQHYLEC